MSQSEFKALNDDYDVSLELGERADIGLMEGFVTLPFDKTVPVRIRSYPDLDPRQGGTRDWKGEKRTYDGHVGTDFLLNKKELRAGAPGVVYAAASGWPDNPLFQNDDWFKIAGNLVMIDHLNGFLTVYYHMEELTVPDTYYGMGTQRVERGQVIGKSGNTGQSGEPHVHMGCHYLRVEPYNFQTCRDLFRDLLYDKYVNTPIMSPVSNPVSFWTKDNDPQYPI